MAEEPDLFKLALSFERWAEGFVCVRHDSKMPHNAVKLQAETAAAVDELRSWVEAEGRPAFGARFEREYARLVEQAQQVDMACAMPPGEQRQAIIAAEEQGLKGLSHRLAYFVGLAQTYRFDDHIGYEVLTAKGKKWRELRTYPTFDRIDADGLLRVFKEWLQYSHILHAAIAAGEQDAAKLALIEALQAGALVQRAAIANGSSPAPMWWRDFGLEMRAAEAGIIDGPGPVDQDLPEVWRERVRIEADSKCSVEAIECVTHLQSIYQAQAAAIPAARGPVDTIDYPSLDHFEVTPEVSVDMRGAARWAWKRVRDLAECFCNDLCEGCLEAREKDTATAEGKRLLQTWRQKQRGLHEAFRYLPTAVGEAECRACAIVRAFRAFPTIARYSPSQPVTTVVTWVHMADVPGFDPAAPENNRSESFPCCKFSHCVEGDYCGERWRVREDALLELELDQLPPMPPPALGALAEEFAPGQRIARWLKDLAGPPDEASGGPPPPWAAATAREMNSSAVNDGGPASDDRNGVAGPSLEQASRALVLRLDEWLPRAGDDMSYAALCEFGDILWELRRLIGHLVGSRRDGAAERIEVEGGRLAGAVGTLGCAMAERSETVKVEGDAESSLLDRIFGITDRTRAVAEVRTLVELLRPILLGIADSNTGPADGGPMACVDGLEEIYRSELLRQGQGSSKPLRQFQTPPGATWEDVTIRFIDGHTVSIVIKEIRSRWHYAEMGMANKKNREPTVQWRLLRDFSEGHGLIDWSSRAAGRKNQKRRENLGKDLRAFFGIEGDPIRLTEDRKGWQTRFTILPD